MSTCSLPMQRRLTCTAVTHDQRTFVHAAFLEASRRWMSYRPQGKPFQNPWLVDQPGVKVACPPEEPSAISFCKTSRCANSPQGEQAGSPQTSLPAQIPPAITAVTNRERPESLACVNVRCASISIVWSQGQIWKDEGGCGFGDRCIQGQDLVLKRISGQGCRKAGITDARAVLFTPPDLVIRVCRSLSNSEAKVGDIEIVGLYHATPSGSTEMTPVKAGSGRHAANYSLPRLMGRSG